MLKAVFDLLLPPLCLNCDAPTAQDQALCADCWKKMTFIAPPFCACCGVPFDFEMGEDAKCTACFEKQPAFSAARSALVYDEASKSIILRFKHADRHHPAKGFAQWMKRAGQDIVAQSDLIVPVPLHRWRLLARRENQAVVLARALARETGLPMEPNWLRRIRATVSQGHLSPKDRAANVNGAFAIPEKYHEALRGRKILLVDDVLTTGATVSACARTLLKAGAVKVNVLTLARVKKE